MEELKKQPVVFIHGAWHGAWCWDQWIKLFKEQGFENTIAVELRGHGYKAGSFERARLKNYVQDVETIISKIEGSPILIGHSLGCTVIRHLKNHERFTATTLLAPIPGSREFRKVFAIQMLVHPLLAVRSVFHRSMQPWVSAKQSGDLFFSTKLPREQAREYVSRMQGESFRLFILDLLRDKSVNKLQVPALLVAAGKDRFFSPKVQRKLSQQLGAEFAIAEISGHDIMLDVESENVAKSAVAWLNSLSKQ